MESKSRTSRGVRGLKFLCPVGKGAACRRTSRGVRGLKFIRNGTVFLFSKSHLSRGAWIEIVLVHPLVFHLFVAPLAGCVD